VAEEAASLLSARGRLSRLSRCDVERASERRVERNTDRVGADGLSMDGSSPSISTLRDASDLFKCSPPFSAPVPVICFLPVAPSTRCFFPLWSYFACNSFTGNYYLQSDKISTRDISALSISADELKNRGCWIESKAEKCKKFLVK